MLGKMRKMLKSREGFTLIELITVLVILAVIMAIGIPKYMQLQAQSEWDTDKATITSFAKVAEVYSAQNNHDASVTISELTTAKLIDPNTVINRDTGGKVSGKKISDTKYSTVAFTIDPAGNCTNLSAVITAMIGLRTAI